MHLEDEEIQRVLHGELAPGARAELLEHLQECLPCRRRLDEAGHEEEGIFALLRQVDHPVPVVRAEGLMVPRQHAWMNDWKRKAALIALALGGAGVAYAAPGSPLPGWVRAIGAILARRPTAPPAAPAISRPSEDTPTGGIAVVPRDRFTIDFTSVQERGAASVLLTDGPDIMVRAVNGTATFLTDVDRLTISNEGSAADYQLELPRSTPWVEIRVGSRRVLLKEGSLVHSDTPVDRSGRYAFSLAHSQR